VGDAGCTRTFSFVVVGMFGARHEQSETKNVGARRRPMLFVRRGHVVTPFSSAIKRPAGKRGAAAELCAAAGTAGADVGQSVRPPRFGAANERVRPPGSTGSSRGPPSSREMRVRDPILENATGLAGLPREMRLLRQDRASLWRAWTADAYPKARARSESGRRLSVLSACYQDGAGGGAQWSRTSALGRRPDNERQEDEDHFCAGRGSVTLDGMLKPQPS
jgi:hypothetical protein